jgi:hypothetical protein
VFVRPKSSPPRFQARRDAETHAALVASGRRGRQEDVRRARWFARFAANRSYTFHGCASIGEYGRRIGFGWSRTRDYVAAGRVIERYPAAEALLLDGVLAISTLASLAPFFTEAALRPIDEKGQPKPFDDLLTWARERPDREIRREVHRCREEARVGQQTVPRTLHFSSQGSSDLDRAQTLLARRKRRTVSQSEAVQDTLREFVSRHDPLEQKAGTRRAPPMPARDDGGRHPRSVPAEVRRALMAKHGDRCAIALCDHRVWLENSHHHPHALGGGNEIADQDRLCARHHAMKDHGEITWVPDASYPGGGYYRTREGKILRIAVPSRAGDKPRVARPARAEGEGPTQTASSGDRAPDRVEEGVSRLLPGRQLRAARPPPGDLRRTLAGAAGTPAWPGGSTNTG